jgi:proteasome accessory factor A
LARKYTLDQESDPHTEEVLDEWERILEGLESDPASLADSLDWVAKLQLVEAYRTRDDLTWSDTKLKMIDLQYHDVRQSKGLYAKLARSGRIKRLVAEEAVKHAIDHPPTDTRAYFRGECLRKYSPRIVAASWDSLIFDTGDEPLRKVPTMEPLRGTKEHVSSLLDSSPDASTLLRNLST